MNVLLAKCSKNPVYWDVVVCLLWFYFSRLNMLRFIYYYMKCINRGWLWQVFIYQILNVVNCKLIISMKLHATFLIATLFSRNFSWIVMDAYWFCIIVYFSNYISCELVLTFNKKSWKLWLILMLLYNSILGSRAT